MFTYEKQKDFEPLKAGEYEVFLENYQKKTLDNGRNFISLRFRVREDIEQEGQNRVLFDTIWSKKDDFEDYITFKVSQLLDVTNDEIEDGKVFSSVFEALDLCVGKPLIAVVVQTERNGEITNEITRFKFTKNPNQTLKADKEKEPVEDLADDELPF